LPEVANQPRRHAKVRQAYTERVQGNFVIGTFNLV
jgi:hypothetical protein